MFLSGTLAGSTRELVATSCSSSCSKNALLLFVSSRERSMYSDLTWSPDLMNSSDYVCLPANGASGGIIIAWSRTLWSATTQTCHQHPCRRPSLYADDLVILVAPVTDDLTCLQQILQLFTGASGLVTNIDKCVAMPIQCTDEMVNLV